jgi:N-acetyl sugar amidotransferase
MNYCKLCLQPDTRPGTIFKEGICPACNFTGTSDNWDWQSRIITLKKVIDENKTESKTGHDCILGVSGGKDSTRLALWARDYLGLNPLLVAISYPPEQLTKVGAKNLDNLAKLGFDLYLVSPSPITWKKLVKSTFLESGNWAKSTELALFSGVPRVAIELQISLILWGENPALQLGASETLGKEGWDGNSIRNMNTLSGMNYEWLSKQKIDSSLLNSYIYPSEDEFKNNNIQIIYLGWAMKNWGLLENGILSALNGLSPRIDLPINTSDLAHFTSLDEDWVILNQMIKYYKYGFGRATDYVNEWIRSGKLTRDEGIEIVRKFDGKCDEKYIRSFINYIGITEKVFWGTVHKFTNYELFEFSSNGKLIPNFQVGT